MRSGFKKLNNLNIVLVCAIPLGMALGYWLGQNSKLKSEDRSVLAQTKNGPVTERELIDFLGNELYVAELALYQQKKSRIESYLKSKISIELNPNFDLDQVNLSDQEVNAAILDAKLERKKMSEKDYRNFYDNLRLAKAKQKREEEIQKSYDDLSVEFRITPPRFQQVKLQPGTGQILGSYKAPVEVISLSNSHCPQCRMASSQLEKLQSQFGDRLRISLRYRGYDGEDSLPFLSAEANHCAGLQNKFWDFYKAQVEAPPQELGQIQIIAKDLSLDEKEFSKCMQDRKFKAQILEDQKVTNALAQGIEPLLVINGSLVSGLENLSLISDLIRSEIK